ncbi:response regulator transcription factor [Paenibacillus sp. SYP-B4298]|uniref:response regulator transcription factor n=1 Tax=Paenibacillus sp. SYP-B4298 TaxID=2996034 RepID=UPI0022DD36BC|nr:response regulator [Paenibacillus sp. SYP-B4298]
MTQNSSHLTSNSDNNRLESSDISASCGHSMVVHAIIVDDEQWNREMIKTFGAWDTHGIHLVGEAEDGEEAIRLLHEQEVHIIMTDMNMPGIDGIGLLQYLNEYYPAVRIIVISGYDDFHYTRQAIRSKADEYLLKPVDPQELNAVLLQCRDKVIASLQEERILTAAPRLELLHALQAIKPVLAAHYNDLNAAGVQESLMELERQIAELGAAPEELQRIAQELELLLDELRQLNSQPETGSEQPQLQQASTWSQLLQQALQLYAASLEQLTVQRRNKNRLNLEEIRHILDERWAENMKLDALAKTFFVSKEYLSKAFKQEYGVNLTDYLTRLKMEHARRLLTEEGLSIRSVAELCGYEELGYFYRVFKKHYGQSPGEMRKGEHKV